MTKKKLSEIAEMHYGGEMILITKNYNACNGCGKYLGRANTCFECIEKYKATKKNRNGKGTIS